jgi:S1-C subfamily serine protease
MVFANGKTYPAKVLEKKTEWYWDWVILESEAVDDIPAARVSTTELVVGDTVYSWHQPYGYTPILSRGIYQGRILPSVPDARDSLLAKEILEMRLVSFDSDRGASGGLVFNARGEAVGLIHGGFLVNRRLDSTLMVGIPR